MEKHARILSDSIAPAYDCRHGYGIDDAVMMNGRRYVCTCVIPEEGEKFNINHWRRESLQDSMVRLMYALAGKTIHEYSSNVDSNDTEHMKLIKKYLQLSN